MQALIVGSGTMGRWFADVTGDWLAVSFTDIEPERAADAAAAYDVDSLAPDEARPVDLVCTAVPLSVTAPVIAEFGSLAERAFVDLSGIMEAPVAAMREHTDECERVSLHPLFAPENAPGNIAVVAENSGKLTEELVARLATAGNHPFETTVEEHDRAMETVQAKTHAALIAYALAAEPVPEEFQTPISSELSGLAAAVLSGTPQVYAEIQTHFPGAEAIAAQAAAIAESDEETFMRLYRQAARRLSEDTSGG